MTLLRRLRRWVEKRERRTSEPAPLSPPHPHRDTKKDLHWEVWRLGSLGPPNTVKAAVTALHQRGWTPADYQQAFEAAHEGRPVGPRTATKNLATAVVSLAVVPGMTPERTILALRAGLTPADLRTLGTGTGIDWDGVRAVAALRAPGSRP